MNGDDLLATDGRKYSNFGLLMSNIVQLMLGLELLLICRVRKM